MSHKKSSTTSLPLIPEQHEQSQPHHRPSNTKNRFTVGGTRTGAGRLFGSVRTTGASGVSVDSTKLNNSDAVLNSHRESRASTHSQSSTRSRHVDSHSSAGSDLDHIPIDADSCYEYLEGLKSDLALQLEINKLELLASLVPARIVRHHMSQSKTSKRVFCRKFDAAVLFADISGFSNLAERLVKEINHVAYAAENLSRYIGASLEQMVATICNKGGDVIKFAGDAILAVFPVEEFDGSLEKATLCCTKVALELVSYDFKVAGRSNDDSNNKAITLSVHCGVGCGSVIAYHVGGRNNRWEYVVTGPPVEQIGVAEPEAKAGETVLSKETYKLLGNKILGKELESGNFLLEGVHEKYSVFADRDLIFVEMKQFTSANPLQYKRMQELLRCYVPQPALVSIDSGNGIWSGELRVVSTVFCRLLGLRYEGNESDVNTIQRAFQIVHKHIDLFEGTLLRFIVDDKGAGVLTAFGLPPLKHENDSVRAIKASLGIQDELTSMRNDSSSWNVGCSIGITTGEVFCGTVGGQLRCEYTLHGVKVNLAARLMVGANKGILCDKTTYRDSKKYIRFGNVKYMDIKGKVGKAAVYRPRQQKMVVSFEPNIKTPQVGRKDEEILVKRLLRNVMPNTGFGGSLVVAGEAGMGKTRLCQYVLSKTRSRPFITLAARGDDTEIQTPFFLWKSLLPQLIQYFLGETKLARADPQERLRLLQDRIPQQELLKFAKRHNTDALEDGDTSSEESEVDEGNIKVDEKSSNGMSEVLGLLWRVLPSFFNLSEYQPKETNTEAQMINLVRLLVEILVKAASDLENSEEYFDVSANGIRNNKNCVRIVMIIEDLQWADRFSIEAIYRLIERMEPIAIVLTCRENMMLGTSNSNVTVPSVVDTNSSPGAEMLGNWYRSILEAPNTKKCELKPLKQEEIHQCLKQWIGASTVPSRLTRVVFEKSQGHPFFASELCKLMMEDKIFSVEEDSCVLSTRFAQGDDLGLPSTVSALMTSRLDRIPASEQLTLKVAAVIGNEFRMHVLASVLLGYTGGDDDQEQVLEEPASPSVETSVGRSKSMGRGKHSSYNHEKMVRALQVDASDGEEEEVKQMKKPQQVSVAAAGDLREISKLLDENISNLVKRGFLSVDRDANGEQVVRFSSVMLRESAYSLLLFKMRKALHVQVAEFYKDKFEDYLQPVYFLLANHYFCAEAYDRAMYYLEIAGNDAIEIQSMQPVWICFTRLLGMTINNKDRKTQPWKRASWYRKVGEAHLFFGQVEAAEESFHMALDELELNLPSPTYVFSSKSGSSRTNGCRRKSWLVKVRESLRSGASEHAEVVSGDVAPPTRPSLDTSRQHRSSNKHLVHEHSSGSSDFANATVDSGLNLTADANKQKIVRGGSKFARHANTLNRGIGNRSGSVGSSSAGSDATSTISDTGGQSSSSRPSFFSRLFGKGGGNRKKVIKSRSGTVQRTLRKYKKVEDTANFKNIYKDGTVNVEMFVEASRCYNALARLVEESHTNTIHHQQFHNFYNVFSPLGLQRRLNAMTLAQAAHECSLSRPEVSSERVYDFGDGGMLSDPKALLNLNDHKVEVKSIDPRSVSLDELALCYSSLALFFVEFPTDWGKELSNDYYTKTIELFPKVKSGGARGNIAMRLGKFALVTGVYDHAEYYLKRSTWIFNFLQFHLLKLESLEIYITLQLFKGESMRSVVNLAKQLYKDGVGIFCVNCLCSLVEIRGANYDLAQSYLEQILSVSLEGLVTAVDNFHTRVFVQDVCLSMKNHDEVGHEGLVAFGMLMGRRYAKRELALQIMKLAGSAAREALSGTKVEVPPVTSFCWLVSIFQCYMESFDEFADVDVASSSGSDRSLFGGNTMNRSLRRLHSGKGDETSEYDRATTTVYEEEDPMSRNRKQFDIRSHASSELRTPGLRIEFKKFGQAKVIRKQSVGVLQSLLDIIDEYAAIYPPCKAYAMYCRAIFQTVRSNKLGSRAKGLFERCAELAHQVGQNHLKLCCLLELAISRKDVEVLKQLEKKFQKMHAPFEMRRASSHVL